MDSGAYLSWCQADCQQSVPLSIASTDLNSPNIIWKVENREDGKKALKASNGKYLGLCKGCLTNGFYIYNHVGIAN
jgi:NAD(P)H-flavin reductase